MTRHASEALLGWYQRHHTRTGVVLRFHAAPAPASGPRCGLRATITCGSGAYDTGTCFLPLGHAGNCEYSADDCPCPYSMDFHRELDGRLVCPDEHEARALAGDR